MATNLCKHTSKHEAMPTNEKVVLGMVWAALNRPKTVAKMTKTRDQNTHTHMHMLRPKCLSIKGLFLSTLE